jgi:glycosyltransferase involved in cell wall biosynthesis
MEKLSIIIPAFNEEKTIVKILEKVKSINLNPIEKEIIVIDNNSNDKTLEIAKSFVGIKVFTEKEKGKGSAVKTGISNASGDFILIQDADLEYNPEDIPKLLQKISGNKTVVYGSRNLKPHRKGTMIARVGVWFLTKEFNLLFGTNLTDLWTCYKLFPKEASQYFESGGFESELSFSASLVKNGFDIKEVSISYNNPRSVADGKKIRYIDGIFGIIFLILHKLKK